MLAKNPIIPGFNPDPSICRVGGTFYVVCSSFQFFPGLPIYQSSDLINWKQIGNAFNRIDQLNLNNVKTVITYYDNSKEKDELEKPFIYNWGICAPTLRYHSKLRKFFLVCTLVNPIIETGNKEYVNFLLVTDDISDESKWSDPIFFEFHGIDPDIYFHESNDNIAYITGSYTYFPKPKEDSDHARTSIMQFQIDLTTGKRITNDKLIWKGWPGCMVVPEGPHIYKRKNWYYLLVSDGGTFTHHMLTVARSKNLEGPYSSYEQNPIFTHDPTGKYTNAVTINNGDDVTEDAKILYFQNCGHADCVNFIDSNTGLERWFAVLLAVRSELNGKAYPLGRETVLVEFHWDAEDTNGWPTFNIHVNKTFNIDFKIKNSDDLVNKEIAKDKYSSMAKYLFIKNPILENYKLYSTESKTIEIKGTNIDLTSELPGISFISLRQTQYDQIVNVKLADVKNNGNEGRAGLCLFKDKYRIVEIGFDFKLRKVYYSCNLPNVKEYKLQYESNDKQNNFQNSSFRIQCTKENYLFEYSLNNGNKDFTVLGEVSTEDLTAWDFTGTLFGLFNIGNSKFVKFDDFEIL